MRKNYFFYWLLFASIAAYAQEARVYRKDNKVGLVNANSQPITPADYDQVVPGNPYSIVKKYDTRLGRVVAGAVDASGALVVPLAYTDLKVDGLRLIACIKKGNAFVYGLISPTNQVLIPIVYKSISSLGTLRYAAENENEKWALFNDNGEALTDFVLDAIKPFSKDICFFEQDGSWGILNREGKTVAPAIYRTLSLQPDGKVVAQNYNRWLWLDATNRVLKALEADSVISTGDHNLALTSKGMALYDSTLQRVTPYYQTIKRCDTGGFIVKSHQRNGALTAQGNVLLPCLYDSVVRAAGYWLAKLNNRWQIFSGNGQLLTLRTYEWVLEHGGLLCVKKQQHWGVVAADGKEILACVYDSILQVNETQIAVLFKGSYGILSKGEQWLTPLQPHPLRVVNAQVYIVQEGILQTVKDFTHTTLYFTNNELKPVENGFEERTNAGEVWHISWRGVVTKLQQAPALHVVAVEPEHEGYRAVYKDSRWGFVDNQGRLRIPNRYDAVKHFSEGLAPFSLRKRWGFINKDDEIIFHPAYEDADPFVNGLSRVKQKGLYGLINKKNEEVLPCRYDWVQQNKYGLYELQDNGLYGLADAAGKLLYEPKYNSQHVYESHILVERAGKLGLLDNAANAKIPILYTVLLPLEANRFLTVVKGEKVVLQF